MKGTQNPRLEVNRNRRPTITREPGIHVRTSRTETLSHATAASANEEIAECRKFVYDPVLDDTTSNPFYGVTQEIREAAIGLQIMADYNGVGIGPMLAVQLVGYFEQQGFQVYDAMLASLRQGDLDTAEGICSFVLSEAEAHTTNVSLTLPGANPAIPHQTRRREENVGTAIDMEIMIEPTTPSPEGYTEAVLLALENGLSRVVNERDVRTGSARAYGSLDPGTGR